MGGQVSSGIVGGFRLEEGQGSESQSPRLMNPQWYDNLEGGSSWQKKNVYLLDTISIQFIYQK